jgi:hypothetical protein
MNQLEGVDCAQLRYDVEVIQLGKSAEIELIAGHLFELGIHMTTILLAEVS